MEKNLYNQLLQIARNLRGDIIRSTAKAGSGHPSSSLSAVELMTALFFGGFFKTDLANPKNPNNDRLIFSKGHASPLFYALYKEAGAITEAELMTLREFSSPLEGHPTPAFRFTEASTGSLGQGLSVGLGIALHAKYISKLPCKTFVLLGDSEMAEGSVWEAMELATHYKLDNLIGIIDVNRLGQRGETMAGHNLAYYESKAKAFGWNAVVVKNGHDIKAVARAYEIALKKQSGPVMIIAKTIKGKGVSFIEDKNGWHGKSLSAEEAVRALAEIGTIKPLDIRPLPRVENATPTITSKEIPAPNYADSVSYAPRKAYGNALARIFSKFPTIVALDAEVSNSTFSKTFQDAHPDRFFEMFIAEQNMASAALGLALRGSIPFVSSFGAFLSRAADQIRMNAYSDAHIVYVGSHCGVSIGADGVSQMALSDIALFRSIQNSIVLYPSDAYSAERLVEAAASARGSVYLRTTREELPIIYSANEQFPIGGSKTLRESAQDAVTIVVAGATLHEALAAHETLKKQGVMTRVIDLYSIKPIDVATLQKAARETKAILVVEDHYEEGGIGEAVMRAVAEEKIPVRTLAVSKIPHSGTKAELYAYENLDAASIAKKIIELNA